MKGRNVLTDNRGFALILTVLMVSLMVVLTLHFSRSVRSALFASANLKDGVRTGYMARSGFNCGLALLSEDAAFSESDSLLEPWADSKRLSAYSDTLFENGRFELEIVDLTGKIQINKLVDSDGSFDEAQKGVLERFLSLDRFGLDADARRNLIDAIKDWIDPDHEPTRFGAENGYYQSLDPPYGCKNGPMEALGELLAIKGMSPELFYGTPEDPGISNYLTVRGEGQINVNTADPLILKALAEEMDASLVEEMIQYRRDEDNDLHDPEWYKKVPGMGHVAIEPSLITSTSRYFEIRSTGISGSLKKRVWGTVRREDPKRIDILGWKIE